MLKGKHLIAGDWVGGECKFNNEPVQGETMTVARALQGQLTCTLHLNTEDAELGRASEYH